MTDPFAEAIQRGRNRPPHVFPVESIDKAIDSYADRTGEGGPGTGAYSADFLAEIYSPRVQELFDLQRQGFDHARWGWDEDKKTNRWHGVERA